ncbi:hypothetical protein BD289DRAFT_161380 [Coniella lustricola]|uniref:ABM domain-containing protein n=1 Tax=Coniella lustricola TaxID=2025994 RepID=A0A2T2ZUH3_9PEZI|nr:hypothetical protein BD289DRAFT_161380 [Coniella lustricola]
MPVTEIGGMRVRAGLDVQDDATPEAQIVRRAYEGITREPTGPYRIYWGLEIERPEYFWGLYDFASVEDHQKFAKEHAGPHVRDLGKVFEHNPRDRDALFTRHIQLPATVYPLRSVHAPVTEIMYAFFPADISHEAKDSATQALQEFIDRGLNECADVQGVDYAWSVETDVPVREKTKGDGQGDDGGKEPQKGVLLFAGIGWPSIEAHLQFRETDAFKNSVGLLRAMEGLISITMFHVKFRGWENAVRKE